ncbi:hypothetical protein IM40_08280 [Candidatus Paracaedimonas acanthamoebae]|nr:hypothetical protein IM40_08280 [Candidatus Paracaedimonas acanthamoebae]
MRNIFFIATLFQEIFIPSCIATYEKYIDEEGNITDGVAAYLKLTGIYTNSDIYKEETNQPKAALTINSRKLQEVVNAVQGKIDPKISWMMEGKRWEMYNPLLTPATAKKILEISLQELNLKESAHAQRKDYKGILLLGATAKRFHERILFANHLPVKGINFSKVYILTGQRPLEEFEKEQFPLLNDINDEGDMTLALLKKDSNAKIQENYFYIYSKAPPKSTRATTESTVHEFMRSNPEPGVYLAVSNGYFIPYQELVIQNCLDKYYPGSGIQVVGVGPNDEATIEGEDDRKLINRASIFLDNLSRILYNLQLRDKIKK